MLCWLGAYPKEAAAKPGKGPVKIFAYYDHKKQVSGEKIIYDYNTIKTCDEFLIEFSGSVRKTVKAWNQPTQYWLLRVYPKIIRICATGFISALWHGVHLGYFMCFSLLPLILIAEKPWDRYVKIVLKSSPIIFIAFWALKICILAYFAFPFFILDVRLSLKYWAALDWWAHKAMLILLIYAAMLKL
ncbi:hypothetical protein B4U79_10945 [Dinothrombium tinctorium]|uniref:Lysophospholipid acyltransferase 7-like protein n=1 Tax=Dinothrombium tinctorium TaxID=1965070 RepID=A0A443RP61_9ACAR|nr:hypothetical protein B4U79_10945 [Dinothrombium tinctorium]